LSSLGGLSARRRLESFIADVLIRQGDAEGDRPVRIRPPLRLLDVAAAIMTTPVHLSRLLRELEEEGMLRRERGWLIAPRPDKLLGRSRTRPEGWHAFASGATEATSDDH
jgi:CRP-like cAMP-binding protein